MTHLQNDIIPKWKKLGLLKDVIITQSNLDDATQIQQMRQLVDQGVDAIIVCCSNPTALNQSVKYAYDHGVPTFSLTGYLTSPYSVNASVNYQLAGFQLGKWLTDQLGGKGNVMVVEGIPGTSGSNSQDRGVKAGLATASGVKIVGDVAGMWTDQVAQGEVQKWLATNPGQLDGIVVQSAAELGVLRALQQSGRDMIPIAIGGELGALCYWRQNPKYISASYQVWPPADEFALIWNIMMRTLEGQGPKVQSIMVDPIQLTYADIEKALPADCSMDNDGWLSVGERSGAATRPFLIISSPIRPIRKLTSPKAPLGRRLANEDSSPQMAVEFVASSSFQQRRRRPNGGILWELRHQRRRPEEVLRRHEGPRRL